MSIEANTILKADIVNILTDLKDYTGNQEAAIDQFATQLSDKIGDAIQRGIQTATYNSGLVAGTNPVTGVINLTVAK
jgi:hypothetical protein